jgi:hypothetical protein
MPVQIVNRAFYDAVDTVGTHTGSIDVSFGTNRVVSVAFMPEIFLPTYSNITFNGTAMTPRGSIYQTGDNDIFFYDYYVPDELPQGTYTISITSLRGGTDPTVGMHWVAWQLQGVGISVLPVGIKGNLQLTLPNIAVTEGGSVILAGASNRSASGTFVWRSNVVIEQYDIDAGGTIFSAADGENIGAGLANISVEVTQAIPNTSVAAAILYLPTPATSEVQFTSTVGQNRLLVTNNPNDGSHLRIR